MPTPRSGRSEAKRIDRAEHGAIVSRMMAGATSGFIAEKRVRALARADVGDAVIAGQSDNLMPVSADQITLWHSMRKMLPLIEGVVVVILGVYVERLSNGALLPVLAVRLLAIVWANWGERLRMRRSQFYLALTLSLLAIAGASWPWFSRSEGDRARAKSSDASAERRPVITVRSEAPRLDLSENTTATVTPGQSFLYSWRSRPGQTACALSVNNDFRSRHIPRGRRQYSA